MVKKYGVVCIPRYSARTQLPHKLIDQRNDILWDKLTHKLSYKCHWYGRMFYALPLEYPEKTLSYRKLAESLARRARKMAKSNEKFNKRTAGAVEMSLPSEEESAQQKLKE